MNQKDLESIRQMSFEINDPINGKFDENLKDYIEGAKGTVFIKWLVAYAKAISLFTGGNVASTRDPSKYDQNKAKNWIDVGADQSHLIVALSRIMPDFTDTVPTKEDYENANKIISYLANTQSIPDLYLKQTKTLYRGIYNVSPSVFLGMCKPGEIYSIGEMSSTSADFKIAEDFIIGESVYKLVYQLDNSKAKRGLYAMNETSVFPHEKEIILGGNIKVNSFEFQPKWEVFHKMGPRIFDRLRDSLETANKNLRTVLNQKTITDFDQLIWYVNFFDSAHKEYINNNRHAIPREPGFMLVYGEII